MNAEAQTVWLAVGIAAALIVALVLCSIGRTVRQEREDPPPEGKVTSSAVIRPTNVRPSGAPMDPGEGLR